MSAGVTVWRAGYHARREAFDIPGTRRSRRSTAAAHLWWLEASSASGAGNAGRTDRHRRFRGASSDNRPRGTALARSHAVDEPDVGLPVLAPVRVAVDLEHGEPLGKHIPAQDRQRQSSPALPVGNAAGNPQRPRHGRRRHAAGRPSADRVWTARRRASTLSRPSYGTARPPCRYSPSAESRGPDRR